MKIDEIVESYQRNGDGKLIEYIQSIVEEKSQSSQWNKGIVGQSENLTTMLLYEYATSIEKLTKGKIIGRQVIDKLSTQMVKLRFGDFKKSTR